MWRHWILGFILCLTENFVEMLHNNFNVFYSNMIYIDIVHFSIHCFILLFVTYYFFI